MFLSSPASSVRGRSWYLPELALAQEDRQRLKRDLRNVEHGPSDEALIDLMEDAERIIALPTAAASETRPDAGDPDMRPLLYPQRMAAWSGKAAKAAPPCGCPDST